MIVIYKNDNGEILQAFYDNAKMHYSADNVHVPHSTIELDEISDMSLCKDLVKTYLLRDSNGLSKYYVDGGEITERQGWEPDYNA